MGRSKFPGKPSKSINRKRISVVQLDDETTTAAQTPTATSTTTTTTASAATTTTTSGATEEEQTQKDAEEKEDSRRSLNNKHVTVSKSTLVENATKTEKRKNGAGGAIHCSDNNGANEQSRHHDDDDDDSDTDVRYRQGAMTTTATNANQGSAGSGNNGGVVGGNNCNISTVNGKTNGRTANDDQHHHKYLQPTKTTTTISADDLAEDSQYSSDDGNQHEVDEGRRKRLNVDGVNDEDEDVDDDDDDDFEGEETADNVDLLFPAKQRLCDSSSSLNTFGISLFGKNKSSISASSSSYAAACSPSASSHSSNCSSSSSTSGCGVSRAHYVGSGRWNDSKSKGGHNKQTQRKKFANLNVAKAEVMLPSTSKWKRQQQELKEECKIKNAEVGMDEQQEKLLNCYVSAISTATTMPAINTTTESSCNSTAAAVTSALAACTTTTATTTSTTGSVLKCVAGNTNTTTTTTTASAVDASVIDSLSTASNVAETTAATPAASENKMATSMSCTTTPTTMMSGNGMAMCASPSAASTTSTTSNNSSKQKKTVTFKNILETSDDKTAVKKFYNPDNRLPLVSIMKKEAMARHTLYSRHNATIVRPSRLTEILKNNANIDKLNALKFRTNPTTATAATTTTAAASSVSTSNIFGGRTLSRVFGAPDTDDEEENQVAFRPKDTSKVSISSGTEGHMKNDGEDDNDDNESLKHSEDDDDDDEDEAEEEEQEEEEVDEEEEDQNVDDEDEDEVDNEEARMIVDKHFVLPKRSTRSSRVIKPNKRLLEDGIICQKKNSSSTTDSTHNSHNNNNNINNNSASSNNVTKSKSKKEHHPEKDAQKQEEKQQLLQKATATATATPATNYFGLGMKNTKEPTVSTSTSISTSSLAFSLTTNAFSSSFGGLGGISMGNLKANSFVLRQPRLQFDSLSTTTTTMSSTTANNTTSQSTSSFRGNTVLCSQMNSTFSLNSTNLLNLNTSANCGVCGAMIHSKNMQQARKYGVPACEVCRKFISKMTKKSIAASASPSLSALQLQCKTEVVAATPKDATTNDDHNGNAGGIDSCNIQAHVKSHMKNFKKIYKERCAACWLKKCLQNLQWTSSSQKQRLLAALPKRHAELLQVDTKPGLEMDTKELFPKKWKTLSETTLATSTTTTMSAAVSDNLKLNLNLKSNPLAENNVTFGSTPLLRPALVIEKPLFMKNEMVEQLKQNADSVVKHAKSKRHKEKHHEKDKDKSHKEKHATTTTTTCTTTSAITTTTIATLTVATTSSTAAPTTTPPTSSVESSTKRQRIDLKGPRVKHVCRSASIVLGQPLATFGDEAGEEEDERLTATITETELAASDERTKVITHTIENTTTATTHTSASNDKEFVIKENSEQQKQTFTAPADKSCPLQATKATAHNINIQKSMAMNKKYMNTNAQVHQQHTGPIRRKQANTIGSNLKSKTLISIDFWENYDPAEVCQTGFGLIVTEPVAQRALCFLCGSTGMDALIFCACCCEPYHQYCVLDEYNLKHFSLDDTMASLLDTSATNVDLSHRLNWLCPRCTVCYTCNMSSGAKVRCQKCQKNYHSTCLGTSKRLLGADRPLICVNCLKCKSCGTTKVSKFVGNLPMCTVCFRLRKKGNFCPICQKCYEENDFDLKMMECGDCQQWVHSKCEGLSDEQYNLLSTLPESIEFICKRCARRHDTSKARAQEWRQAVAEEFKTSLMSVLKLLSKSRQACVLLKMSPRKKLRCTCGAANANNAQTAVKSLTFNSDGESQHSDDVYEFKDKSLNHCSCLQNNSYQFGQQLSLVDIKQKIANDAYTSLAEFNYDMNNVIQSTQCDELIIAYKEILSEQFPWFQNETKACTDALEDDMFESCNFNLNSSLDEQNEFVSEQQCYNNSAIDLPADLEQVMYAVKSRVDNRVCLLCRKVGEDAANAAARLLYCGHDCWVHTNCALWSAEVFEEIDGSLQNVHSAVARGRMIKCSVCGNRGASVGCNVKSCGEHYHYPCARSIDCAFLSDKSMYCPAHASQALKRGTLESNFEVARPVYVELERKRSKKLVEPGKVQFHIGSLEVKQLGSILPRFSDCYEALIPINFLCSRLYWSHREPWKIVEYTVRTTIQNSFSTLTPYDMGRNFTVDHSNPNTSLVQLGLTQITRWHNSLARGDMCDYENGTTFGKLLPEYMNQNSVSAAGTDENTEEEPQNNADLLPPEVKDAIFEDLPHELLDGISMLDIFPKFMIYEDSDATKAEFFLSEHSKDGSGGNFAQLSVSDEDTLNSTLGKQLDLNYNCNAGASATVSHVEDAMLGAMGRVSKQAKLFKNRVPQPRVWSNSVSAIKRRKLSKCESVLLSLNHQRKKETATATVAAMARRHGDFTWSAAKRYIGGNTGGSDDAKKLKISQMDGVDDSITEFRIISTDGQFAAGTVKCDRCHCTYRTYDSFQRHLPNCEALSTSESESEAASHTPDAAASPLMNGDALAADFHKLARANINNNNNMPYIQAFPQSIALGNIQANINSIPLATNIQNIAGMQSIQNLQNLQNFQSLQNMQLQGLQTQTLGGNFFISQNNNANNTLPEEVTLFANPLQALTANLNGNTYTISTPNTAQIQPANTATQPQLIAVSTGPDGTPQFIQLPASMNTYQTLGQTNNDKKIIQPVITTTTTTTTKGIKNKQGANVLGLNARNKMKANNTLKSIQSKMLPASHAPITLQLNTTNSNNNATQLLNQNLLQQMQAAAAAQPQLLFQTSNAGQQQQQQQPPIIMQQQLGGHTVPQNIISFVTADGNQNPQLQYVSLPTTNDRQNTPFITTNGSGMQGAFLQTDASGNIVLTTAPQAAPSLQMLSTQPQVIGTLIQPQTLQLSNNVLTTTGSDTQLLGGAAGAGLEVLNAGNNNGGAPQVILATQPMYYGLETIVQNTVMSSQQFVSNTLPGVLSQNATFSATTTQVFQASKIEPIVDIPTGYVVLNNVDASGGMQQPQTNGQQTTQQATFLNTTSLLQQQEQQQQQQAVVDQQQAQYIRINTSNQAGNAAGLQFQTATIPQQHQQPQQQQQFVEPMPPTATVSSVVTAKIPPVAQVKRNNTNKTNTTGTTVTTTKVQPQQVVNKVLPTTINQQQTQQRVNNKQTQQQQNKAKLNNSTVAATIMVNNSTQQQSQQQQQSFTTTIGNKTVQNTNGELLTPTLGEMTTKTTTTTTNRKQSNLIRPLTKAEVKPKVIRTNVNKQQQQQKLNNHQQTKLTISKPQQQQQQQPQQQQMQVNNTQMEEQKVEMVLQTPMPVITPQLQQQQQQSQQTQQWQQQRQATYNLVVEQQLNNGNVVYEYSTQSDHQQQHQQQQQMNYIEQTEQHQFNNNCNTLPATTTTTMCSTATSSATTTNRLQFNNSHNSSNNNNLIYNGNVPTNIVNPMQQIVTTTTTTTSNVVTTSRPTNRVLPMQQRPDPPVTTHVSTVSGTMTKSVTTTKMRATNKTYTNNNNNNNNNLVNINEQIINNHNNNNNNSTTTTTTQKIAYEAEVKKDQQMLQIINSTILQENYQQQPQEEQQQQQDQQQMMSHIYNIQQTYEQQEHETYMNIDTDAYKCMESATSSSPIRCEQLNLMADFDNDCLLNAKEINCGSSPEEQAYSDMACDENEMEDDEFADGQDECERDEDDDGFSLKMPHADGENDISDCDEPQVKETISKILDNLTNEDCGDSVVTATTAEVTSELNNQTQMAAVGFVQPINTTHVDVDVNYENNRLLESEEINAATAAEFISQIDMATVTSKCLEPNQYEPKKVSLEKSKLTETALECLNDDSNAQTSMPPPRKASPPPPMPREARKISGPHLLYEIQSEDGFTYKSPSISEIWEKVFEAVQVARRAHGLTALPEGPLADMCGVQMIGLKTNPLRYLIEQLPGVERCTKYTPKYHKPGTLAVNSTSYAPAINSLMSGSQANSIANSANKNASDAVVDYNSDQEELQENLYESARCEPFSKRSDYDMFSWLASRHRKQPVQVFVQPSDTELVPRRGTGSNLPMAMKYRTLKETYKDYVGVFRSQIHGRGLYCTKDIEAGEMVIEYAGELIRSTLTDKRERHYDSRGIGCYMFKIDDNLVVDATMRGNAARFINHSCEPNCYSKVVDILGHKHIIIFALRRIVQGEELTYDYKFPFEEEKIPCSCGSKKCRKYLN